MPQVWQIRPGAALSTASIRESILAAVAERAQRTSGRWAVPILAGVREHLDTAWSLNQEYAAFPAFAARALRRQGRLDRALRDAAEALAKAMDCIPAFRVSQVRAEIFDHLWQARHLVHVARGSPLMRRLRRPQAGFNASMAEALSRIGEVLLDPSFGLRMQGVEAAAHLRWHIGELPRLCATRQRRLRWLRRLLRDQRSINHCAIMTIKLAAEVLEKGSAN